MSGPGRGGCSGPGVGGGCGRCGGSSGVTGVLLGMAKARVAGDTLGSIRQNVSQTTTGGAYYSGEVQNGQEVPSLCGELGLSYRSPGGRWEAYLGGYYQYWWNVGALPNYALNVSGTPLSNGELSLTGVTLRLSFNY